MKDQLKNIENYLRDFFENRLQNLAGKDLFTEITKSVMDELKTSAKYDGDHLVAPNIFRISINLNKQPQASELDDYSEILKSIIKDECLENGFTLPGPIHIQFYKDDKIEGMLKVISSASTPASRDTARILALDNSIDDQQLPLQGYLVTSTDEIFELSDTIINIGRQSDNQLVVDNLLVSRLHAQIRALKGKHVIFDIDSSAGTKVNGQRIRQHSLNPGDVIEIADVSLIYYRELDKKHRSISEKITRKIL